MTHVHDRLHLVSLERHARPLPVSGDLSAASWLSGAAVICLVVAASGGLLYGGDGLYPSDPELLPQFYGQDAVALIVAVPALLLSMWTAGRGSVRGLIVWLGILLYVAYWYHFYLAGTPFGPMFLVHVLLVSCSVFGLVALLFQIDLNAFHRRIATGMPARALGRFIAAIGTLFALIWVADIMTSLGNHEALDPVARSVYAIDLTLMLPATIAAGLGLSKHRPWAFVVVGPLLVNAVLSMLTLLVTTVLVDRAGESAGPAQLLLFPIAAVTMLICLTLYLRDVRA